MAIRITISLPTAVALALAVAFTAGASALIRANAGGNISADRVPLPVATTRYVLSGQYQRTANYVGTVRAASDSAVGFEVAGTLDALPAREGMRVREGEVLGALNTERRRAALDQAQARADQSAADLELAQKRLDRIRELAAKELTSRDSLDEASLAVTALSAARDGAQAALEQALLDIEKSTLRAPFDAIVAERLLQPGSVVNAGTPVLRLVESSGREAHVGIPVDRAQTLKPGEVYTLRLRDQRITATLRGLRDDVDPSTLTVGAVLVLPDDLRAHAGESVVLELREQVSAEGGWLPLTALIEGHRGLWTVLTTLPEGDHATTTRESVEVVYVEGDQAYVRGTLRDGAEVVATGLQRISPGALIAPQSAETRR